MSKHTRMAGSNPEALSSELIELGRLIAELPEAHRRGLEPVYHQVVDTARRRRRILSLVQEALSQLRLDIKYLMFDLEATREERDALKQDTDES